MGMTCGLQRISDAQIDHVLAALRRGAESEVESDMSFDDTAYLDKAWHGIHFLLTGSAWGGKEPLCYLLAGGESAGGEEDGMPAHALRSSQVAAFDEALQEISTEEFRRRFDPEIMTQEDIYPSIIWRRDPKDDDALGYLVEYFESLKKFVHEAHENNRGLLISIC